MNFETLNLIEPLLRAVRKKGYETPSAIQQQAIPVILNGSDLLASAQTGTGKTAAFTLPIIQQLSAKARAKPNHVLTLILVPTRELAVQVHESVTEYGQFSKIRSTAVYGGVKIKPQIMALRNGVEVLVATPGRLFDLYKQKAFRFDDTQTLILDEADRMLDMGFIDDIQRVISFLPRSRQSLLFSATFSTEIRKLAKQLLKNPIEISVAVKKENVDKITQVIHPVDKSRKTALLCHLMQQHNWHQALVFAKTKLGASKLAKALTTANVPALAIHGDKTQFQRTKALAAFKNGKIQVLVATDVVSRGIDIEQLPIVVNFDLPQAASDYIHRIGRTGRAGKEGHAVSLVCADEFKQLRDIETIMNRRIERVEVEDFQPSHHLPTHVPTKKPSKGNWKRKKSKPR